MYELENVTKVYRKRGEQVHALRGASLQIGAGEYVAIIGASGSGKTTLLSLLGGMLSPDGGQVLLHGESLYRLSVKERTQRRRSLLGFVFQTFNLIPYLTALENVQVPLFLAGVPQAEHRERATALLDKVGLGNRLQHKPSELSTGQQQRVALARTLVNNPQVILADEPTGNLDPDSRALVLQMFDQFVAEGRTVVMVTHDPNAAARAARRLQISDGAITEASRSKRIAA
jgi:putative ABC transport system ATP-binding protein